MARDVQYNEQDVERENNKQAQAPGAVFVTDESSIELDVIPMAQTPTKKPFAQTLKDTLVQFAGRRSIKVTSAELDTLLQG